MIARIAVALAVLSLAAGVIVFLGWRPGADEPPTITVEAAYPGATASTVEQTTAVPIEQQINGVEHLRHLRSRCGRDGSYRLEVSFAPGTDLNLAQVLVQNRVALALPALPAEIQRLGITVKKQSPDPLMIVGLVSPDARFDATYLGTYATVQLKRDLSRLPGVAEAAVIGGRELAVRIHLDPDKLAARALTFTDVMRALEPQDVEANAVQPAGPDGAPDRMPDAPGEPMQAEQFQAIVIKADEGRVVRLRDVATLELGAGPAGFESFDGRPAAVLAVYPTALMPPGDVGTVLQDRLAELRQQFPDGVEAFTGFDAWRKPTAEAPGYLVLDVNPPDGTSADQTARLLGRVEQSLRRLPGVRNVLALSEQPFDRDRDQPCLVISLGPGANGPAERERLIHEIRSGVIAAVPAAAIRLRDLSGAGRSRRFGYPIEFAICGPDHARVQELAGQLVARLSQDRRLTDVWAGPRLIPATTVEIDRAKAASLGVDPAEISAMLRAALGHAPAGRIERFGRSWSVQVDVNAGRLTNDDALDRLRFRTDKGQMVPLRAVAALRQADEPARLERLDLLPAVSISASPAGRLTLAEARSLCERLAAEVLPKQPPAEYKLVWPGEMPAARAPAGPEPPPAPVVPPSASAAHPIRRAVAYQPRDEEMMR
jgi:multidrug efflux pump subunit AcrB